MHNFGHSATIAQRCERLRKKRGLPFQKIRRAQRGLKSILAKHNVNSGIKLNIWQG